MFLRKTKLSESNKPLEAHILNISFSKGDVWSCQQLELLYYKPYKEISKSLIKQHK